MNNSAVKWIAIIVIVVLIGLGLWWLLGQQPIEGSPSNVASTTPQTSTETSGAGAVTVNNSTGTVAQVVAGIANGGRYAQLLSQTGVSLSGKGPYTVFVATDGAYSRLVPGTINSLSSTELKRLVQYSIVSGKKLDVDAVNSGQVQSLSGDPINFQVDAAKKAVYVNSGYVLSAYNASNGIVYVINAVLIPPTKAQ